jgi:hypothetical protein
MDLDGRNLRIGVYVGQGASHSWTWFVDLMEKYAYGRLRLIQEDDFPRLAPDQDVLLVSGGDTFAVARALESPGARALEAFLERGGLYIGSCAGAYLPLNSSKAPLDTFNFVKCRINNLTRDLPPVRQMPLKFSTRYGCDYIYHPVREDVRVRIEEGFPVWGGREVCVPLYGGPPLTLSDDIVPRAFYTGFTERTCFLTEREIAETVYVGKVAACEKRFGKGRMVLLGPHFEHPWFPEGNDIVHQWIQWHAHPERPVVETVVEGKPGKRNGRLVRRGARTPEIHRSFKREISNMRIRAHAMTRQSVHWQIGAKVYEPEKVLHFVDTIWKRLTNTKTPLPGKGQTGLQEELVEKAAECNGLLKELAQKIDAREDSQDLAEEMFSSLKALVVAFLGAYFGTVGNQTPRPHPHPRPNDGKDGSHSRARGNPEGWVGS